MIYYPSIYIDTGFDKILQKKMNFLGYYHVRKTFVFLVADITGFLI